MTERITVEVSEEEMETETGLSVTGVCVECPVCEEQEKSYGTHSRSVRRCIALLKEKCDCDYYLVEPE